MIKKFIINPVNTNYTLELELSKPNITGIYIKGVTGLGYPSSSIPITDIALSDIDYYNHSTFNNRNVVFTFGFVNGRNVEELRQEILKVFPAKQLIKITILTDLKEVYIQGYVETLEANIFEKEEIIQVSILCTNPYFINTQILEEVLYGSPIYPNSNRVIDNGLWMYVIPTDSGIDSIKIAYPNGSIGIGDMEKFKNPFSPDVTKENIIQTGYKILIDTNIDTFGIFNVTPDDEYIDISENSKVIGSYPYLLYGTTPYNMFSYRFDESEDPEDYLQTIDSISIVSFSDRKTVDSEGYIRLQMTANGDLLSDKKNKGVGVINICDRTLAKIEKGDKVVYDRDYSVTSIIGNIIIYSSVLTNLEANQEPLEQAVIILCEENPQDMDNIDISFELETHIVNTSTSVEGYTSVDITQSCYICPNPFYSQEYFNINSISDFKKVIWKWLKSDDSQTVDDTHVNAREIYYSTVKTSSNTTRVTDPMNTIKIKPYKPNEDSMETRFYRNDYYDSL